MSDTKGPKPPAPPPPPPVPLYQDDEPLGRPTAPAQGPAANGGLVLSTQCEFPAVARFASRDRFAVLVHTKAPSDVARAPLDLVTVLDVSGSMAGEKLALLKLAMCFVIDQLGPGDRLSVVTFSNNASRLTRLARMSDDAGKASAKMAVQSLAAVAGTNIKQGLRVGAEVLAGRREKNVVAGMILLSDGHETCGGTSVRPDGTKNYVSLVPPSFVTSSSSSSSRPSPIHTFGFGTSHDSAAMHAIAEATGGTFSFVGNQAAIQDSFARCIGGLLLVAVQEARVAVTCLHRGVHIQEVKSGAYVSHVATDDASATIDVGELYDGEQRRFLVLVHVPRARSTEEVTRLIKASCTYREAATGHSRKVAARAAVVQRPLELTSPPAAPNVDVERERVRLAAAEDIAAARVAADGGQNAGAARILESRLKAVEESAPGAAGDDPTCEAIKEELRDLTARVGNRAEYQQTGRACLLAGMSSHAQQRASGMDVQSSTSSAASKGGGGSAYLTPKMEEISRESSRKRGGGSSSSQQPVGTSGQAKLAKIEEV